VLTAEEEKALVMYAKKCSDHYYGLSINEFKELAYEFAKQRKVKYPSNWDDHKMCGRDWYYGFMRRHKELTLRTPEQTSLNRVKSFSKENVQLFFRNLDAVLSEHPYQAANIWNMDETGFSTVPTKIGKVISVRGARKVGQISSQERGSVVTMALAVNAEGNSAPPFFLFDRKNMQSVFLENASPGAVGFANGSGWMQQTEFVEYMKFFVDRTKASKQSPILLLLDNHSSHLSIEALDLSAENGITILSFPPHCSHRLQPLDVSVYGPVKAYYKSQCSAWQKNNAGKVLEIRYIPGLVRSVLDLALTPRNIKAGFLSTGICPYNPDIFADSDFVQAVFSGENERAVLEAEVTDGDLQRRTIVSDALKIVAEKEVASSIGTDKEAVSATRTHEELASSTGTQEEEASSKPSTSTSCESSLSTILSSIGPVQAAAPTNKKSNRGRRAMKSTILTSPESRDTLREKQEKRDASNNLQKRPVSNTRKSSHKTPAKRGRPPNKVQNQLSSDDSESEDEDFCIICFDKMPRILSRNNSVACIECKREVHLKCAKLTKSYFICQNCESE